jgi:tetratricopeptide (TPR) repeat protein
VHMPSHTYIRIGRYHEGAMANLKAVEVDSTYTDACHAQGVYPLAYYPHNYHFIAACAALCGESKIAMVGAIKTSDHSHKKLMQDPAWATLQHYFSIPMFTSVKLGLWKEIKQSKEPEKNLVYPRVIWNYTLAMAALAENKTNEAQQYLKTMRSLMTDTTLPKLTIWGINSILDICKIAENVVAGEIEAKKGNYSSAISYLKTAVKLEDALNYNEPPDWFFSVRHNLGAVLVSANKLREAKIVYEEDLVNYRDNGWALRGLMNVYEKAGNKEDHAKTEKRFKAAWKHADIAINASRIL